MDSCSSISATRSRTVLTTFSLKSPMIFSRTSKGTIPCSPRTSGGISSRRASKSSSIGPMPAKPSSRVKQLRKSSLQSTKEMLLVCITSYISKYLSNNSFRRRRITSRQVGTTSKQKVKKSTEPKITASLQSSEISLRSSSLLAGSPKALSAVLSALASRASAPAAASTKALRKASRSGCGSSSNSTRRVFQSRVILDCWLLFCESSPSAFMRCSFERENFVFSFFTASSCLAFGTSLLSF
mmetsp:Transcript_126753/g.405884  ORF Transcript_126753/g.405884 Transcript_126753/m.405884 type:complete len:241 (-) Transcript_126753:984-1706(-)